MLRRPTSSTIIGMIESGTLLLADISGYTRYLADSDLRHGPSMVSDLLTRVVETLRPVFRLSKVEGDAVFAYSARPDLRGVDLLEVVDATYSAFRRRLLSVGEATSCGCAACGMVPALDLKLLAHSGEFIRQRIAGQTELVGTDVNILHRLLKNGLGFAGRAGGYLLVTDACARTIGLDHHAGGFFQHVESYPHLGAIDCWVTNLEVRWRRQPTWVGRQKPIHESRALIPADPPDVWHALTPGRADSCVTDRLPSVHDVIESRPYERRVVEVKLADADVVQELVLEPTVGGTVATLRWHRLRRRPRAPSWEEIASRLGSATEISLEDARLRFAH